MNRLTQFIHTIFAKESDSLETEIIFWRRKIADAVFYFFTIIGFFSWIYSFIMSIREGYYLIAAAGTIIYLFCIFMTFKKGISFKLKTTSGAILFYTVGVILIFALGPAGAGSVWLLSATILLAFLIGNRTALLVFFGNCIIQFIIAVFIRFEILNWYEQYGLTLKIWSVKGLNFIVLNFMIIVVTVIFTKGFKSLITKSSETRDASIIGLAKLAEYRDTDTGNHLQRIQKYTVILAGELAKLPQYQNYITQRYITDLHISSILHDIGKVGIQDAILLKPGALTPQEFEKIKAHPVIGGNVILEIEDHINGPSFYNLGKEIAMYHHEKWDGSGYPEGLRGEQIPLSARIVALVDVYDALTSVRPYKPAISHQEAVDIILKGRGRQFDPEIVDIFSSISDLFKAVLSS